MTEHQSAAAVQDSTSAKPDTDLDLDDVAATSQKAKAELEALRNNITLLEQKLADYRTELIKVNNEFGCQTADWPDAWRRVAVLKQDVGRFFREGEALRAENARLRADAAKWQSLAEGFEKACNSAIGKSGMLANANRYAWLRDLLSVEDVERLVNERAQWSWCETDPLESAKTDAAVDRFMEADNGI